MLGCECARWSLVLESEGSSEINLRKMIQVISGGKEVVVIETNNEILEAGYRR